MLSKSIVERLQEKHYALTVQGSVKREFALTSAQSAHVIARPTPESAGRRYLNLCSNNYLGLANDPRLMEAAREAIARYGLGMASVRFISGTNELHWTLESKLATFMGTEAALLFPSAFDANGALFETLTAEGDTVVSDELNHASIIDGLRLCRATRHRYANRDVAEADDRLRQSGAQGARWVVTDGVFSMDGFQAPLNELGEICSASDSMLIVDDSHGIGVIGETGRGTAQSQQAHDAVDLYVGTLGKALGGAAGGFVAGPTLAIETLRQFGRPYLFSNALMPAIAAASIRALDIVASGEIDFARLRSMSDYLRSGLEAQGYDVLPGTHPIIPVMFHDAVRAESVASSLADKGILAAAFSFPVVPRGAARLRLQLSLALSDSDVEDVLLAFKSIRI
ncbi:hypothetical protein EOS_08840 [Caballeronia mineralivorans PML1(12)]|uniref:Aminotransferase class I/classII large domain-containing protein n=1 Tax=Caballeronia mineralivorans PML1(12) TaxID=908627 RepID=A0A0J1D1N6_9BURK|nr:glycine C-acetyltransferase [Caballeronia mineralivorans]KLU26566.1 hypothetical protein EOS_08840 [Caballeronia mineralivorans PML1(12)]